MKANIERLTLIPNSGAPFDITDMVQELSIFQSTASHYMHCEAVMMDTVGISRAIPQDIDQIYTGGLTGGEILLVQYYSAANPVKTHAFMLYERSNRSKISDSAEAFILNGISIEGFEAYSNKISKAYGSSGGSTGSDIIKAVYKEYIGTPAVKDIYSEITEAFKHDVQKELYIDGQDSGLYKYIIPNLTVDETVEFICNETDTEDHIPQYFFFENSNGFWFYSLGSLAIRAPRQTFKFTDFNVDTYNAGQKNIISFEILNNTNILENAKKGLFKSKTIHIDAIKKKYDVSLFDYQKTGPKFKKLQPTLQRGDVSSSDVNVTMMTTRTGHDAGDVVELQFPLRDGLREMQEFKLDKELSGKYIITELRNKIEDVSGSSTFVTVFECVKDTEIIEG
jgi:hypothetical protein